MISCTCIQMSMKICDTLTSLTYNTFVYAWVFSPFTGKCWARNQMIFVRLHQVSVFKVQLKTRTVTSAKSTEFRKLNISWNASVFSIVTPYFWGGFELSFPKKVSLAVTKKENFQWKFAIAAMDKQEVLQVFFFFGRDAIDVWVRKTTNDICIQLVIELSIKARVMCASIPVASTIRAYPACARAPPEGCKQIEKSQKFSVATSSFSSSRAFHILHPSERLHA